MKKLALLVISGIVTFHVHAQFSFVYDGPQFLYADENCLATLDWGHPNTPQAFPTAPGQVVESFEIFSISGGYTLGSQVPPNQVITVFYEATDNFGQSALYGFNLFTTDSIAPTFDPLTLPDDITVGCNEEIPIPFIEFDDNCESDTTETDLTFTEEGSTSACDGGTLVRTWTVTDESSNSTQYVQTITVLPDTIAPVFTGVPVNGTAECGNAMAAYTAWLNAQRAAIEVSDNGCGVLEWTDNAPPPIVLTAFCGILPVDFFVEDSCGNVTQLTVEFSVTNNVPPVVESLAQDITVDCSSGSPQQVFEQWLETQGGATATDDCSAITWYTFPEEPLLSDTCGGSSMIYFIADDGCGNTDSTMATVTVIDTTAPVIDQQAQDRVVNCSSVDVVEELGEWISDFGNVVASDLCSDSAAMTRRLVVNGEMVDSAGLQELLQMDLDSGCIDDVVIGGLIWDNVLALIDVEFTIADRCGNEAVSEGTFAVTDLVPPVFDELPRDTMFACGNGSLEDVFADWYNSGGFASAMDDCGNVVFMGTPAFDSAYTALLAALDTACASGAGVTVEFSATDLCGNASTDSHSATFSVLDSMAPMIAVDPSDAMFDCEVSLEQGIQSWLDTVGGAQAIDDCGAVEWTFYWQNAMGDTLSGVPGEGPYPGAGQIDCSTELMVLFVASDVCGNSASAGASFSAIDTIGPVIEIDTSLSVISCDSLESIGNPVVTDNCDASPDLTFTDNFTGSGCPLQLERTWVATDLCGNSSSAIQVIEVTDTTPPEVLSGPDPVNIPCSNLPAIESAFNQWVATGGGIQVADNCGDAEIFMAMPGSYDIDDPGTFPGTPPVLPSPDSCSGSTVILEVEADVVYFDACDNAGFLTTTFMVTDTIPPVLTGCVDTLVAVVDTATCLATFSLNAPVAFDACPFGGAELSYTISGGPATEVDTGAMLQFSLQEGIHELLFRVIDCAGNTDSCITYLRALDTLVPSILCPVDILIDVVTGPCEEEIALPLPDMPMDECGPADSVTLAFSYSTTGSTVIPETPFPQGVDTVFEVFNVGETQVFYFAEDLSGNRDTCSFFVTLLDTIAPGAVCQDATGLVHPAGDIPLEIDAGLVDGGSFDNCGIREAKISPSIFPCDSAGTVQEVQLVVEDFGGNTDTCTALVTIEVQPLEPGFSIGLCEGDTLQLFANAPAAQGNPYTFDWTGPDSFSSNDENPIIPDPGPENAGTYTVVVTGLNGCTTQGSVDVFIDELGTPQLMAETDTVCLGDSIRLEATDYSQSVIYLWYSGNPPDGDEVGSSPVAQFSVPATDTGTFTFYVIADAAECTSNPSEVVEVTVISAPEAMVVDSLLAVCIGDAITLGTPIEGNGITYAWSGPNGFSSDQQNPVVTDSAELINSGDYEFSLSYFHCPSEPVIVKVDVFEPPVQPAVDGDTSLCPGDPLILTVTNVTDADEYIWIHPDGTSLPPDNDNILELPSVAIGDSGGWTVVAISNGCPSDTSEPFFITVEPLTVEATNDGPVCEGGDIVLNAASSATVTYQWTGPNSFMSTQQSPMLSAVAGVYNVVVTSQSGCMASDTTMVRIDHLPQVTALSSTAGECANGVDDVVLQLTVFPADTGSYAYSWFGPAGYSASGATPSVPGFTSTDNGTYKVVVRNGACVSDTASLDIEVKDTPPTPSITGPVTVCEGDTIELETAQNPADSVLYIWSTPLGTDTTVNVPSLSIPGVQVAATGAYTVSIVVEGCMSMPSEELEITVQPALVGPTVDAPGSVCEGSTVQFCANGPPGALYFWSGPGGFGSQQQCPEITDFSALNAGEYSVYYTIGPCISETAMVVIDIRLTPQRPEIEDFSGSICLDDPGVITLCVDATTTTPGATYIWLNSTTGDTLANSGMLPCADIDEFSSFGPGLNGVVAVAVLDGCPSANSPVLGIRAFEYPAVISNAGPDQVICPGEAATLNAAMPPVGVGNWYTPDPEIMIDDPNDPGSVVSGLREGENILIWSLDYESCLDYSRDTVIIVVQSPPMAVRDSIFVDFGEPVEFNVLDNDIADPPFTLTKLSDPTRGNLLSAGNGNFIYSPDIGFVGQDHFIYEICSDECPAECSEAMVLFQVGDENDCFVPSIFTPNGDGINDELIIPCLETDRYPDNSLVVFNQWGGEVFRAQPYLNDWEGTFSGEDLPVSTYYYVLDFADSSPVRKGFILIER